MKNPFEAVNDAVNLARNSFELGERIGSEHNRQADAHNQQMIDYSNQREQVLQQQNDDFEMPDVGDF